VFAHLDRASFAVDTVLTVDDQPLSIRILLSSFRIYILVDSSRASSSKKSSVFFDIRLDVSCSIRFVDVKVNGLILSVVRTGSRDGGENVERENTIGCWVIDRLELTVSDRPERVQFRSSDGETVRFLMTHLAGFVAA